MMKMCYFCQKRTKRGYSVSFSHKKSKRKFLPNLLNKTLFLNGQKIRVKICASCLKKIGL